MEESSSEAKLAALAKRNAARLASKSANKLRRTVLDKKVIELKLDSKLSKVKVTKLSLIFFRK